WTDSEGNRWKGYEGAALTDTLSTPIPAAEFGGVEVTVRKDSATHRWRFFQPRVTDEGITYTPPSGKTIATGTDKNTVTLTVGESIGVNNKSSGINSFICDESTQVVRIENAEDSASLKIVAHQAGTAKVRILYILYGWSTHEQVYCITKPLEITVTASEGRKTSEEKSRKVVEDLSGDAKKAMEELLNSTDTTTKKAAQDVAATLHDSLSHEEISKLSAEEISSAVTNKKDEATDAAVENEQGIVQDTTKPAGTDLLANSTNDSLTAANDLSVKPKVVTPVGVSSEDIGTMKEKFTNVDAGADVDVSLVKLAAESLKTSDDIVIETASASLEDQMKELESLLTQVAEALVKAINPRTQNIGMVIATSLPKMRPEASGFFPMKVNLRNLTPGRKLMFWPSVKAFKQHAESQDQVSMSLADVSVAEESQEGKFFFLDKNKNPVSVVSGDASDMYVVPYLAGYTDYSDAFITADATSDDRAALQKLADSAGEGTPASNKGSGGCNTGFAGLMLLLTTGLLLTKKR
ncbi:MAG: SYNERG-CTERM sorting domain-containing protein, partial [Fretibacterium sp.]|nr:SYNERG-CTERM sorting domain-containing protein [Fretibacterium sp.]